MTLRIVVIGAGYAGSAAIKTLERKTSKEDIELLWISDKPYHFMLHESHRVIRNPSIAEKITFPVSEIKRSDTKFIEGKVKEIDSDDRKIILENGRSFDYDYSLIAVGSETAYYDIEGMYEYGLPLKNSDDAKYINKEINSAVANSKGNKANIVVGGAGLTGIQCVGEIAEYRDLNNLPIEIYLVEAAEKIYPQGSKKLRKKIRKVLKDLSVNILREHEAKKVDKKNIYFDANNSLEYDVLIWGGGIRGPPVLSNFRLNLKNTRLETESDLTTSEKKIFAVGDAAFIEQDGVVVPPTSQAAWTASKVASKNIIRSIKNKPLKKWRYEDKGTLISIGDRAFANNIKGIPLDTFGSYPARFLKKFVAARWISNITSWKKAIKVWSSL